MRCKDFLDLQAMIEDGTLSDEVLAHMRYHVATCDSCRKFDHAMTKGTEALRSLPKLSVSPDFLSRLQYRLYAIDENSRNGRRRIVGWSTLVAAGIVAVAFGPWIPWGTRVVVQVEVPESDEVTETKTETLAEPVFLTPYVPNHDRLMGPSLVTYVSSQDDPEGETEPQVPRQTISSGHAPHAIVEAFEPRAAQLEEPP